MKNLVFTVGAVTVLLLFAIFALTAQNPQAIITIEAWSLQELHDLGWTSPASTGLPVVGKGELVYLFGEDAAGEEVTSYAWSFASVPDGSQAVLDSTNTARTTFRPDTTGQFQVQLMITTASGVADTTVTITSATYVGVGIWTELQTDPGSGACAPCHTNKISEWVQTAHPTLFMQGIDGVSAAGTHYNESCIECHTLGYFEGVENGGFWDVQQQVGWTFPNPPHAGVWDTLVTDFPELAKLGSIQCENCHGPASIHKQTFDKTKVAVTLDEGLCGRCHDEEPNHRKDEQWKTSAHAVGVASAANNASCAQCHSGYGFVNKVDPDKPFDQTTGFPQTTCAVCHDPHSAANEFQLRNLDNVTLMNGETFTFGGAGRLCMNCHLSRRDAEVYATEYQSHFGPHHSNQADMLAGANAITFGMDIPSSNHKNVVADACVTCHMAPTPAEGQPGRDLVGEHTFAMHADGVDNVAACQTCHGDISAFADIKAKEDYDGDGVIESAQEEIHGMLEEVGMLLPPLGDPSVNVIPEDYDPSLEGLTPEEIAQRQLYLKAAYNYLFVEEDGSFGVHNFQYAVNLLKVAHEALTTGSLGAGTIATVTDVPNDQGKQVRVVWTKFGADGVSDNPILDYVIWRRVDQSPTNAGAPAVLYKSLEIASVEAAKLKADARVEVDGTLWDFVGSVPAGGMDNYSAIAPTLFDSTKVDGMYWSVFMISGHTAVPTVYAVSAPDSGYSIDNLAPAAPGNLAGQEVEAGVALTWDEAADTDFDYFALYRSTTPGFDPAQVEPLATLTETAFTDGSVSVGTTYYYRLSAFDFSGNESAFSTEFSLLVTSVEGTDGAVPENYVLEQNYPNPFNPSTTIKFALKEAGHVTMSVYNALGEEVLHVLDEPMQAGNHRVAIRAEQLSSGVYFYQIQVNGFSAVKKMVIMK